MQRLARTPEEERAGNRRALLGCGGILLVMALLCGAGYWAIRGVFGAPTGATCDETMDCAWGHYCVRALGAPEPTCRIACSSDADCGGGRCVNARLSGDASNQSVCSP